MVRCHLLAWLLAGDVLVEVVQAMLRLVMVKLGGRCEARELKPADALFCKSTSTVMTF